MYNENTNNIVNNNNMNANNQITPNDNLNQNNQQFSTPEINQNNNEKNNKNKGLKIFIIIVLFVCSIVGSFFLGKYLSTDKDNNPRSDNTNVNDNNQTIDNINTNEITRILNNELAGVKSYELKNIDSSNDYYLLGCIEEKCGYDYDNKKLYNDKFVKIMKAEDLTGTDLYPNIYEYDDYIFTAFINNKKFVVNNIDLTKGNGIYNIENFVTADMPSTFNKCGVWEGSNDGSKCSVSDFIVTRDKIYFTIHNSDWLEEYFILDLKTNNIKSIYIGKFAAVKEAAYPQLAIHNDKFIFSGNDDGNNIETVAVKVDGFINLVGFDNSHYYIIKNDDLYYSKDSSIYKYNLVNGSNIVTTLTEDDIKEN